MTRIRYTMPARSQGGLRMRRRVFVYGVEALVRIPRFTGPARVGTHVAPNDARDSNPRDAVKAIVEATGPSPRLSVRGWPFRLNDANDAEGV